MPSLPTQRVELVTCGNCAALTGWRHGCVGGPRARRRMAGSTTMKRSGTPSRHSFGGNRSVSACYPSSMHPTFTRRDVLAATAAAVMAGDVGVIARDAHSPDPHYRRDAADHRSRLDASRHGYRRARARTRRSRGPHAPSSMAAASSTPGRAARRTTAHRPHHQRPGLARAPLRHDQSKEARERRPAESISCARCASIGARPIDLVNVGSLIGPRRAMAESACVQKRTGGRANRRHRRAGRALRACSKIFRKARVGRISSRSTTRSPSATSERGCCRCSRTAASPC